MTEPTGPRPVGRNLAPRWRRARSVRVVLLGVLLIGAFGPGCDRAPRDAPVSAEPADAGPRIVTLAPAITQMVADLGLDAHLVGVAEHDAAAPPGTAVVGTFFDIDTERLLVAQPTVVLTMAGSRGVPDALVELAESSGFELVVYRFPLSIADVGEMLHREAPAAPGDPPSLGRVLGVPERAQALKLSLLSRLAALGRVTADLPKPDTLLVLGIGPVMASGPGTVHDELLAFAGGLNAASGAAVTAPTYDREALLAIAPEAILLLRPGDPPLTPGDPRLSEFAGLPIPAVRDQRIVLLGDPLVLLPSTSMVRVAGAMARALHPEQAEAIDAALSTEAAPGTALDAGSVWREAARLGGSSPAKPAAIPTH